MIFAFSRMSEQTSKQQISSIENIDKQQIQAGASTGLTSKKYQAQTKNQAEVTIEVEPKQLGIGEEKNIFTVNFNTHSVELDFDFTKIIILRDNFGNSYSALEWTGNRGWHHVNGDIIFPKINGQASSVELQINGINEVDRNFKWILK
jgi:hypothetical protein